MRRFLTSIRRGAGRLLEFGPSRQRKDYSPEAQLGRVEQRVQEAISRCSNPTPNQIRLAKIHVAAANQLGQETPEWIRELAVGTSTCAGRCQCVVVDFVLAPEDDSGW